MRKSIYYLLLSAFMALLSACSDDELNSGLRPSDNETPVSVTADFATWAPLSRAVSNLPEKTGFTDGDVIHVQGEFEVGTSKVWRYDTYKYANGRWKPNSANGDSSLKWPWNATKGSFTAYYLPAAKESLSDGTSYTCDMGDSHLLHDPLVAYATNVERDYAVNFQFEHICTRLVIENTKNNYAEEYWFYKKDISNVFKLGLEPETDEATGATYNKLKLSFVSDASKNEGAISAVKVMTGSAGTASNAGYVIYYLQPGKYYGSDLNYSGNRLYLKLNVDALDAPKASNGDGTTDTTDGLQAGKTYFLDIEKAKGVINTEETEDPWDNKDPVVKDFDVQELIEAINNGKEFEDILKLDNAGNLVLTKNLDFQYKDFTPKNVPTNIAFDGGHHYIMNTAHQLIDRNFGAIRNLEIRQAKITGYSAGHDGVVGVLAANNQGYIDNVRMRNNTVILPALPESENVTSVGGVVGSHENGQITNVYMIGTHSISVFDKQGADGTKGRVLFGGIAGQANGSSPAIKNVSMLQDENGNAPVVLLNLNCSKGVYSVGGVVGMLTTGIDNCTLATTIDCSGSNAADCCVGGLFGREQAFESNGGFKIGTCNVTGTVYGSYATTVKATANTVLGRSMVGGIGGAVQTSDMIITDCRSFCEVYDCFNSGKGYNVSAVTDEVFGSGAAFGRLTANPMTTITRCTAWGKITATPLAPTASLGGSFVGSFVGYAVNGFKQENNNMDNRSVNGSLPFCGYDWKQ